MSTMNERVAAALADPNTPEDLRALLAAVNAERIGRGEAVVRMNTEWDALRTALIESTPRTRGSVDWKKLALAAAKHSGLDLRVRVPWRAEVALSGTCFVPLVNADDDDPLGDIDAAAFFTTDAWESFARRVFLASGEHRFDIQDFDLHTMLEDSE